MILLIRHGESTWNAEHRWAGQADPPLFRVVEAECGIEHRHVGNLDGIWLRCADGQVAVVPVGDRRREDAP